MSLEDPGFQEAPVARFYQAPLCEIQVVHIFPALLSSLASLDCLYHLLLLGIHYLQEVQVLRFSPLGKLQPSPLHFLGVPVPLWRLSLPGLRGSQADPSLLAPPYCQGAPPGRAFLSPLENLGSQAAPGIPLGLEDREVHHRLRGLGLLGVLGLHPPLAVLRLQGDPSFQLVQEAPHPLAVLSSLGHLECLEPQGVRVALVFLGRLFHRNGQVDLGPLETQHFPLCLWDL